VTALDVLFGLVGLVAVGSALLVVTTRQLVHAALWLVVTLGAVAAAYLLLSAEFLAWVQVLIYVGAVVVLLLFGLMLTRAPIGRSAGLDRGHRWLAALVGAGTAGVLVVVVVTGFRSVVLPVGQADVGSGSVTRAALFRNWVLPFELLSVLLLAALVGATVLSTPRQDSSRDGQGGG